MRICLLAFASFLLLASPSFSQQTVAQSTVPTPPSPTRDPQALSLLEASIKTMGGATPADSTATGTVTQTIGAESQQGTIQLLTKGTNQSSEAINLPNFTQTTAFASWMGSQATGSAAPQDISAQLAASSQTAIFPLPLIAGAVANADESFQYLGVETIGARSAQHIRIWNTFASKTRLQFLAALTSRDIWLDAVSNFPIKISFTQQSAIGAVPKLLIELVFSNYTQSSGIAYPEQIAKSINGTPYLTISIQSMVFNTGLTDSNFPVNCSGSTD